MIDVCALPLNGAPPVAFLLLARKWYWNHNRLFAVRYFKAPLAIKWCFFQRVATVEQSVLGP